MTDPQRDPRIPDPPSRTRRRIAADVDTEIAGWLTERTAELVVAGLSGEAAARQARAEFGDIAQTRKYCVEMDTASQRHTVVRRWVEEGWQDLRIAYRTMRRTPALTIVLIATIGLGVGATTAIYSVVRSVLLRPLPYRDDAQLVQLHTTEGGQPQPMGQISAAAYLAFRDRARAFDGVAAISFGGGTILGVGEPEGVAGGRVTPNLFPMLGVQAAAGRVLRPGDDSTGAEPVVLLSNRLWLRRFGGDPAVVGRQLDLSGTRRTIVGVMPAGFVLPFIGDSELWLPLDLSPVLANPDRAHKFRFLQGLARRRADIAPAAAQTDADRVIASLVAERPDAYQGMGSRLITLREETTGSVQPALLALLAAAVLLLLIACANIASVLLAKTVAREPELVVRAALGAGRGRIARQLLSEALALSLAGGVVGAGLAVIGVRLLAVVGASALPSGVEVGVDRGVLWSALLCSIACGLLFGSAPALGAGRASRTLTPVAANRGSAGRPHVRLRRSLVVAQVALSVALLVGAALLTRSLQRIAAVDLGYTTAQALTFRIGLPGQRYDTNEKEDVFHGRLHDALRAIPGVTIAGSGGWVPLGGSSGASLVIEGQPFSGDRPPEIRYGNASDDYFLAMGIPLRRGRFFTAEDRNTGIRAAVISEAAMRKFWGASDPIGARIRLGPGADEPVLTVVGVVGDVTIGTSGPIQPAAYTSQRHDRWGAASYIIRYSGEPARVRAGIRAAVRSVDPLLPVPAIPTFDEMRSDGLADRRLPMQLIGAFSVLAVILASVGLYSVGAHLVVSRRRELGIRLALGASVSGLRTMVLRDGVRVVLAGVALGIPLAIALSSQLRVILFEIEPFDPLTLIGVSVLLTLVGLLASAIPARRATTVDPASALRE
jgi:predicted permease